METLMGYIAVILGCMFIVGIGMTIVALLDYAARKG